MKKTGRRILAAGALTVLCSCVVPSGYITMGNSGNVYAATDMSDQQRLNAWYSQAIDSINNEDFENALFYLDGCVVYTTPQSNAALYADIYMKRGYCLYMLGQHEDAVEALDEALLVDPKMDSAMLIKISALSEQKKYPEAIELLKEYIELTGDESMYETLASLYEANGETDQAMESYGTFAEKNSESEAQASFTLGVYKLERGYYEEALEEFSKCMEDETVGMEAAYNSALCQLSLGKYEEAVALLTQCIDKEAGIDGMYYYRAQCNMALGNYDAAIADYGMSVEKDESYAADALYNKANYEMGNMAYEDAVKDFTACLEKDILPGDSRINRGICYLLSKDMDKAMEDFEECLNTDTNADEARFYRSFVYLNKEDYEHALEDLNVCIENKYDLAGSYMQRAQVYKAMGETEKYKADMEAAKAAQAEKAAAEAAAAEAGEEAAEAAAGDTAAAEAAGESTENTAEKAAEKAAEEAVEEAAGEPEKAGPEQKEK